MAWRYLGRGRKGRSQGVAEATRGACLPLLIKPSSPPALKPAEEPFGPCPCPSWRKNPKGGVTAAGGRLPGAGMLCALAPHLHLSLQVSQPRFLLPEARTASPCALWPTGRRGALAGLGVAIRAGLRRAKQRFIAAPAASASFLPVPLPFGDARPGRASRGQEEA